MPFKEHSPQFVVSLFSVRGEPVEPREHLPFILRQAQDERNAPCRHPRADGDPEATITDYAAQLRDLCGFVPANKLLCKRIEHEHP